MAKKPLFPFFILGGASIGFVIAVALFIHASGSSTDPQGIGPGGLTLIFDCFLFPLIGGAVGLFCLAVYRLINAIR